MSEFSNAIRIIKKYEGYHEKAYTDPRTEDEVYSIGYGTQFYPDGSPVKQGQCCTKQKAMEYLFHEIFVIDQEIDKLDIQIDSSMRQALISFVHSVGWESFLYSGIIDAIERETWSEVVEDMNRWIFDCDNKVIGGLLERRKEEAILFLSEINANPWRSTEILMTAFRNYSAAAHQVRAIRKLEDSINPYVLTEFANEFCPFDAFPMLSSAEYDQIFDISD